MFVIFIQPVNIDPKDGTTDENIDICVRVNAPFCLNSPHISLISGGTNEIVPDCKLT